MIHKRILTPAELIELRRRVRIDTPNSRSMSADEASRYLSGRCRRGHLVASVVAWEGGPMLCPNCVADGRIAI